MRNGLFIGSVRSGLAALCVKMTKALASPDSLNHAINSNQLPLILNNSVPPHLLVNVLQPPPNLLQLLLQYSFLSAIQLSHYCCLLDVVRPHFLL